MVGWALLTAHSLGSAMLFGDWDADSPRRLFSTLILFAMFGLPLSWLVGLLVGFPLCMLAVRQGWTSWRAALTLGALIGLLLRLGFLIPQLVDGSGGSSYGGADGMLWQDGWPTALGWWSELKDLALFGGVGALSALAAWRLTFRQASDSKVGSSSRSI